MSLEVIPAPRRATARLAFIRALATQTNAVNELRAWRRPFSADFEDEREWFVGRHPSLFETPIRLSPESFLTLAGYERVREARDWGRRWNVEAEWLHAWAAWALAVWAVARSCTVGDCPYECRRIREHDDVALHVVLSQVAMEMFGEEQNIALILKARQDCTLKMAEDERSGTWFPIERRRVVALSPGPHPLQETKDEYLERARGVWDQACAVLVEQGISLSVPRKLDLHSEWLVRYRVCGQTAVEIVKDKDREDTDLSTVYKAVGAMAEVIGLPIGPASRT